MRYLLALLTLLWAAPTWAGFPSLVYHGQVGASVAVAGSGGAPPANTFALANNNWVEVIDRGDMFDLDNNDDEVCYRGSADIQDAIITFTFSLTPGTGGSSLSTTAIGIAATTVGNGDEKGELIIRDHSSTDTGIGSLTIVYDLTTDDCIGILLDNDSSYTLQYEFGTLTITR